MCRFDSDVVGTTNRAVEDVLRRVVTANRAATSARRITNVATVQDLEAKALHLVLVRRLDYRRQPASAIGDVVRPEAILRHRTDRWLAASATPLGGDNRTHIRHPSTPETWHIRRSDQLGIPGPELQ